ncbi:MAG: MOSC domain-containing protein [Gammaproteobacteria bacterium]
MPGDSHRFDLYGGRSDSLSLCQTSPLIHKALDSGGHRRNLVIDGLTTRQTEGRSFRIGSAVFRYDKPRPPCGYIDQLVGKGMGRALSHNSGICIRVVSGGTLTVGDAVVIFSVPSIRLLAGADVDQEGFAGGIRYFSVACSIAS